MNANMMLPTEGSGNDIDDTEGSPIRVVRGPNFMPRRVDSESEDIVSDDAHAQASSASGNAQRSMVSHRLEREGHGPGGIGGGGLLLRHATSGGSQRQRGSHPTGVLDTTTEVTQETTMYHTGDDFERERERAASIDTGATSPAMSLESWERCTSNDAEEGKFISYDEDESGTVHRSTVFESSPYYTGNGGTASADDVGDEDTSSVELQKALLMRLIMFAHVNIICVCLFS